MANCVLCEDEGGIVIWSGDDCRVVQVADPDLPGLCRVIWNRHVAEMTDLSYSEREILMTIVFAVEEAMRQVMQPNKVNLASLGNQVPHLHWHIIPRYEDDPFFPDSVWSQRKRGEKINPLLVRQQLALQLPKMIRETIANLH